MARNKGYHSKKLAKLFRKRYNNEDPNDIIGSLRSGGYLGEAGKSPPKYYIADKTITFFALGQHNFPVTTGRERPL